MLSNEGSLVGHDTGLMPEPVLHPRERTDPASQLDGQPVGHGGKVDPLPAAFPPGKQRPEHDEENEQEVEADGEFHPELPEHKGILACERRAHSEWMLAAHPKQAAD